jgi:WD40 repeat protein
MPDSVQPLLVPVAGHDPRPSSWRPDRAAWALAVVAATVGTAAAQPFPDREAAARDENRWLMNESTAALVVAPPPLAGVTRWSIEPTRHRGWVSDAAANPAGTRLATVGIDGTLRIWNLETGEIDRILLCHRWRVSQVAWSPDGTRLATNAHSGDTALRIWEAESGKLVKELGRLQVTQLSWSPDGKRVVGTQGTSGSIYVSDALEPMRELTQIGQAIRALNWSGDGRLVCASGNNSVEILDGRSGKGVATFDDSAGHTTSVAEWSLDGKRIASNGNQSLTVWDVADRKAVFTVPAVLTAIAWSPDGRRIAASNVTTITMRDAADGKVTATFRVGQPCRVTWHPKSDRLLAIGLTAVYVCRPDTATIERTIDVGEGTAPVFRPGAPIVTGVGSGTLQLWDPNSFKRLVALEHEAPVAHAIPSRDGKRLATADARGAVRIYDVKSGEPVRCEPSHDGAITCLAWSPDGAAVATGGVDKQVRVWGMDGAATATLAQGGRIRALAWGAAKGRLAAAGDDKKIVLWDVADGKPDQEFDCTFTTTALAWSVVKGVSALACGQANSCVRVVNTASGQPITVIEEGSPDRSRDITALAWLNSPGPRLIVGRQTDVTHIYDVPSLQRAQRQLAPDGVVETFPVANGTVVVTRAGDRVTRFWDPGSGKLFASLLDDRGNLVAFSANGDVAFDPDTKPDILAVVETAEGQANLSLDEFERRFRWKNNGRSLKLPRKP